MVPSNCRIVAFSLTFVTLLVSWQLARYCDNRLPLPVLKPLPGSDRFVSSLAHRSLTHLTNFGPRPVGSYANDVQAVRFLVEELSKLATSSLTGRAAIEVDVQTVEGSFSLDIFGGAMTQVYTGVKNVVARISPRNCSAAEKPRAALLLNCHFDSVPMGPGASDDGVSCAILLEVARVVLTSKRVTLTNDLVFLFNGAEEALLPASHGFITQHRFAKDIAAFINLEAAGSGGREVLFQAGPGHRWLLDAYITAAPHPYASILCQEVFQSGLIPSDTDFRVFRDFGHVPGLDIAFVKAGEVYHTEFDTSSRIPLGSIQRAGDNVLAVTLRLARRKSLAAADDNGSSSVFFDVLGLAMVALPAWLAAAVNIAVVVLVCLLAWRDAETFSKKMDTTPRLCLATTLVLLASELVTLVLGITFSSLLGLLMGLMGLSMTWYSRPSLLLLLHTCPTVLILLLVYKRVKTIIRNSPEPAA